MTAVEGAMRAVRVAATIVLMVSQKSKVEMTKETSQCLMTHPLAIATVDMIMCCIAIGAIGAAMLVVLVGVVIFVNVNRRKRDYNRHKDPASLNEGAVAVEMTDNPSTVTGAMEGQLATSVGQYAHPAVPKRPSNSKNLKKKHQKSSSVESQSDSARLLYHTVGSMPDMSQISFEKNCHLPGPKQIALTVFVEQGNDLLMYHQVQ